MKKIALLIIIAIPIFLLVLFVFFSENRVNTPGSTIEQSVATPTPVKVIVTPIPSPTPLPDEAVSTFSTPSAETLGAMDQDAKKGALIDILPYTGQYFTFDFSFVQNLFVLTLSKANINQGIINFDTFLKQNGIDSESWFNNLSVTYQ